MIIVKKEALRAALFVVAKKNYGAVTINGSDMIAFGKGCACIFHCRQATKETVGMFGEVAVESFGSESFAPSFNATISIGVIKAAIALCGREYKDFPLRGVVLIGEDKIISHQEVGANVLHYKSLGYENISSKWIIAGALKKERTIIDSFYANPKHYSKAMKAVSFVESKVATINHQQSIVIEGMSGNARAVVQKEIK